MKKILWSLLLVLVAGALGGVASAEVEFSRGATFDVQGAPVDIAVSEDGDWVYVLTDAGDIRIYGSDGQFEDSIHVGEKADFMAAGPAENQLLVGSRDSGTIHAIDLQHIYEIDVDGSSFQGRSDAPVTIVVFMDYQCPYCVRLKPLLEEVLALNADIVKIVYKNFPLKSHTAARPAAAASLVAFHEGKFPELHNLLEENYNTLDKEMVLDLAAGLGFDRDLFEKKMSDPQILKQIQKDISDGQQAGVTGIPTVFVNGRRLQRRNLETFQMLIEKALSEEAPAQ